MFSGRRLVLMAVVFVLAAAVWLLTLPSSSDDLLMGDYGPEKQSEWAQRLIAGLNTHDAQQVPLLRHNGALSDEQRRSIEAVLPGPGCHYELLSVHDRGTQEPGYRFDATVEQRCADVEPRTRDFGVLAIAEMGYWAPFSFATT